jgi:hypothetical protein
VSLLGFACGVSPVTLVPQEVARLPLQSTICQKKPENYILFEKSLWKRAVNYAEPFTNGAIRRRLLDLNPFLLTIETAEDKKADRTAKLRILGWKSTTFSRKQLFFTKKRQKNRK